MTINAKQIEQFREKHFVRFKTKLANQTGVNKNSSLDKTETRECGS